MKIRTLLKANEAVRKTDNLVESALIRIAQPISRRSVVFRLSKLAFGIVGVSIASQILPYMPSEIRAASEDDGLHGSPCDATCSKTGKAKGQKWMQCMNIARPGEDAHNRCCTYTDYCQPLRPSPPCGEARNLGGHSGYSSWCKGAGEFVCTEKSCMDVQDCKQCRVGQSDCNKGFYDLP